MRTNAAIQQVFRVYQFTTQGCLYKYIIKLKADRRCGDMSVRPSVRPFVCVVYVCMCIYIYVCMYVRTYVCMGRVLLELYAPKSEKRKRCVYVRTWRHAIASAAYDSS